jgi:hypothetical protein
VPRQLATLRGRLGGGGRHAAHGRAGPLARSGWPASIRAASRMRQLSQTPQGCVPPL